MSDPHYKLLSRIPTAEGKILSKHFHQHLPIELFDRLEKIAKERKLSLTTLGAIAFENELACPNPFEYNFTVPSGYYENKYPKQCQAIYNWLAWHKYGASVDSLVMFRKDYGVLDANVVLSCIAELLDKKMIEWVHRPRSSYRYEGGKLYLKAIKLNERFDKGDKSLEDIMDKGPLNYVEPAND